MSTHWLLQTVPQLLARYQAPEQAVHAFLLIQIFEKAKKGSKLVFFRVENDNKKLDLPGIHTYLSANGKKTSSNASVEKLIIDFLGQPMEEGKISGMQFSDLLDDEPHVLNDKTVHGTRHITIAITLAADVDTDAGDWRLELSTQRHEQYEGVKSYTLPQLLSDTRPRKNQNQVQLPFDRLYLRREDLIKDTFMARNRNDALAARYMLSDFATAAVHVKRAEGDQLLLDTKLGYFAFKHDNDSLPKLTVLCYRDGNSNKVEIEKLKEIFSVDGKEYTILAFFLMPSARALARHDAAEVVALDRLFGKDGCLRLDWLDVQDVQAKRTDREVRKTLRQVKAVVEGRFESGYEHGYEDGSDDGGEQTDGTEDDDDDEQAGLEELDDARIALLNQRLAKNLLTLGHKPVQD